MTSYEEQYKEQRTHKHNYGSIASLAHQMMLQGQVNGAFKELKINFLKENHICISQQNEQPCTIHLLSVLPSVPPLIVAFFMRVHTHRDMPVCVHTLDSMSTYSLYPTVNNSPSATTAVRGTVFILQLQLAPSATFHLHRFQSYSEVGVGAPGCLVSISLTKHSSVLLLHYLIYSKWGRVREALQL